MRDDRDQAEAKITGDGNRADDIDDIDPSRGEFGRRIVEIRRRGTTTTTKRTRRGEDDDARRLARGRERRSLRPRLDDDGGGDGDDEAVAAVSSPAASPADAIVLWKPYRTLELESSLKSVGERDDLPISTIPVKYIPEECKIIERISPNDVFL